MEINPLHDRVIVKRLNEEEMTPGGIVIPETAKKKAVQGTIVAVGKGRIMDDGSTRLLDVKVNDQVLFGKFAGSEIKINGEELLVMREDEIIARISS